MQPIAVRRFETLAMPHLNGLFQTALQLTGSHAKAIEVVDDAYACALASAGIFQSSAGCRIVLFKILIQRIRARKPVAATDEVRQAEEAIHEPEPFSYGPEQAISALNRLSATLREAILLVDCQAFSYQEVAEILDLSSEAVKHRVSVAREFLRSELGVLCRTVSGI